MTTIGEEVYISIYVHRVWWGEFCFKLEWDFPEVTVHDGRVL